MSEPYPVEVVFALPEQQEIIEVVVAPGATVQQAIDSSGIAAKFEGVDLDRLPVGVWGCEVRRDHVLVPGDRVEIYRALETEPREARRRLAQR